MKDLVLLVDASGKVLQANGRARDALGGEAGRTCRQAVDATDPQGGAVCTDRCASDLAARGGIVDRLARVRGRDVRLVCRRIGRTVAVRSTEIDAAGAAAVTARELEILGLVADGKTDPEVAERLGLTSAAVRTDMENARRKLGVATRSAAVARALRLGLLQ